MLFESFMACSWDRKTWESMGPPIKKSVRDNDRPRYSRRQWVPAMAFNNPSLSPPATPSKGNIFSTSSFPVVVEYS